MFFVGSAVTIQRMNKLCFDEKFEIHSWRYFVNRHGDVKRMQSYRCLCASCRENIWNSRLRIPCLSYGSKKRLKLVLSGTVVYRWYLTLLLKQGQITCKVVNGLLTTQFSIKWAATESTVVNNQNTNIGNCNWKLWTQTESTIIFMMSDASFWHSNASLWLYLYRNWNKFWLIFLQSCFSEATRLLVVHWTLASLFAS